jgi:hypothetical protein
MIFKSILLATLLVASSAFVPNNANPFQKKHTHGRVTSFLSSANKNDFGDDDSFGFFDDDEFEDRIPRKGDAFEFIFDIDDDMKPEDVHIILFNPDTDREGVHTIEFPKGSGSNMILAFESRKECEQFSMSLREQQFFDPTPQEMKLEFLEDYCEQIGVEIQVVPQGMKLKPPTENVLNLGVNPNLKEEMKMLDYLFQISASDDGMDEDSTGFDSVGGGDSDGAWE